LLRGPAIDLSAHIAAMAFQGQVWKDVRFKIALNDGHLQLSPVAVALPGGALQMSLTVDAAQDTAPLSVEMHAPGIPLALIGRYARLPGPMAGAVKVDVQLRGAGHTPHEIAASLNGPISATMTGGSMTNAAFTILTSASLDALGIHVPPQGDTALNCMGLIGAFANGVGKFPTIALDTTYLQLDGKGEVDFVNETTALKLHPLAQISGSSVAVPVVIEGPFHAVKGRLDADGLDKLGLFLDGIFGGDQSTVCADAGLVPHKQE
jgi:AsmA protein